MGYYIPR